MALQNLEGRNAIEAAKQRLATAKRWKKSTARNVKSARVHLESAESEANDADDEIKEAESYLKDAHKMWEVINVGDDERDSNDKRERQASVSPDPASGKKSQGNEVAAASESSTAATEERERNASVSPDSDSVKKASEDEVAAASSSVAAASDETTVDEGAVPDQIVVEGAGTPEVNGTYKRCQSGHDVPKDCNRLFPVFSKCGSWNGYEVTFFIYQCKPIACWYISFYEKKCGRDFYCNYTISEEDKLPCKDGWVVNDGCENNEAPQLKW